MIERCSAAQQARRFGPIARWRTTVSLFWFFAYVILGLGF